MNTDLLDNVEIAMYNTFAVRPKLVQHRTEQPTSHSFCLPTVAIKHHYYDLGFSKTFHMITSVSTESDWDHTTLSKSHLQLHSDSLNMSTARDVLQITAT